MIMGDPSGLSVISRGLRRGTVWEGDVRRGAESRVVWAMSRGLWAAPRNDSAMDSSLEPPEGSQRCPPIFDF